MMAKLFSVSLLLVMLVFSSYHAYAQEVNTDVSDVQKQKPIISASQIPSLFFTYWQHQSIKEATSSRGFVRPPTKAELDAINRGDDLAPKPEERDITLGGIVYADEGEWTIWLNGQRVTPEAVPSEIINLRVYSDYIELKWLDNYTDQIFPIRLRAHERFNLDTRMFLPG